MAHIQKLSSGRWQARYRSPDGRERAKNFTRKIDADIFLTKIEAAKLTGEWTDPRLGRTGFAEWAAEVESTRLDRRLSTTTRDESVMRNLVLPTFGPLPLSAIEPITIRQWIAAMSRGGYAASTTRKAYQLLSGVLTQAVDSGFIPRSPCRGIDLPRLESREMRFLDAREIHAVSGAIEPRYRILVMTASYTGLRFGELAALRTGRLDLLRRSLRVEETLNEVRGALVLGSPKTNASRRAVALPSFLADLLGEQAGRYANEDGFVFTAPGGGPIRRNAFRRRAWLPAVTASVGQPCRFHDLRHSHAAMLIAEGVHVKVLQERLGHASIRTTLDTYGHLLEGLDEAAAEALDHSYLRTLADSSRIPHGLTAVRTVP